MFSTMIRRISRDLTRSVPELEDLGLDELLRERLHQVHDAHDASVLACSALGDLPGMSGMPAPQHGHACENCGKEWSHCDLNHARAMGHFDGRLFHDAHCCPACGSEQFNIAWNDIDDDDT